MRTFTGPGTAEDVGGEGQPVRVDAALAQTVALLKLVGQEEVLLARLSECLAQLRAVQRARAALLDVTDAELVEARQLTSSASDGSDGPRVAATGAGS